MKKATKKILWGTVGVLSIVTIATGAWYLQHQQSFQQARQQAYDRCIQDTDDPNSDTQKAYCNCIIAAPQGVLSQNEYHDWLNHFQQKNDEETAQHYTTNNQVNEKMFICLMEHGPVSKYVEMGMVWCLDHWNQSAATCECVFKTLSDTVGLEGFKTYIRLMMGIIPVDDPNDQAELENIFERLRNMCQVQSETVQE